MPGKFTTVAFCESQDEAGSYTGIAGVADQHVKVSGDTIYVPDEFNHIVGYYAAMGATSPGVPYLDSPSLRRVALVDMIPLQTGTGPSGSESFRMRPQHPLRLEPDEGLQVYSNANPADAEYHTVIVWLSDGALAPVGGEVFTVYATAAITGVAGKWANGTITLRQTLPVGRYALVGATCVASNAVAFRFVPIGLSNRPGGLVSANVGAKGLDEQHYGGMGIWFEFDHHIIPSLDILAIDTCTAQYLWLELVKVR